MPILKYPITDVVIPAFNEENSVGLVVENLPKKMLREIIVVNNNSHDNTRKSAEEAGATVVDEPKQGYGAACLKGIALIQQKTTPPDIVVFIDADYSDYPEQLPLLVQPIVQEGMDMVIGSRALGKRDKGSMTPQQIFGNWLASKMLWWLYGVTYTDLGPFRAIKWEALMALDMQDQDYGWTVEMQVKAAIKKLKATEVPVDYRPRIGKSKVSGTVKGTVMAGYKIITTIIKYAF